jgi:hypothetical protein
MEQFNWIKILPALAYFAYNFYNSSRKKNAPVKKSAPQAPQAPDTDYLWGSQEVQVPEFKLSSKPKAEVYTPKPIIKQRPVAPKRATSSFTLRRMLVSKMVFERKYFDL